MSGVGFPPSSKVACGRQEPAKVGVEEAAKAGGHPNLGTGNPS